MNELDTLWKEEQKQARKSKRDNLYKRILGTNKLPRIVQGVIVRTNETEPAIILKMGGYTVRPNKSWVRKFDPEYRYHAYIIDRETIEIHTDRIKKKYGKTFHIASTHLAKEERQRLKSFVAPPTPKQLSAKKLRNRSYKKDVFTGEKLRQALAALKNGTIS